MIIELKTKSYEKPMSTRMKKRHRNKFQEFGSSDLLEITRTLSSTLEPQKVLKLIIERAINNTGATSGSLILIDKVSSILNIEVARGFTDKIIEETKLKIGEGITGWVAKNAEPLLINDVSKDERYVSINEKIKSELAVPLILEDEVIGVINVDSESINAFSADHLNFLTTLATFSAQVIYNAQLYDTVKTYSEKLTALLHVGQSISSSLDLEEVLALIVEEAALLMKAKLCSIMLFDELKGELHIKAVYGGSERYLDRQPLRVNDSLIGKVVKTKECQIIPDIEAEPLYKFKDMARREGLNSLISIPLISKDKVIGILNAYYSKYHKFNEDEIQIFTYLASQSAVSIENARLYSMMIEVEEQIRTQERLSVLGELAVGMAHEIRNPLTIIKMLMHSLYSELSGDALKDLDVIKDEIDRMNEIANQFIECAKPHEIRLINIDCNHVLDNILCLFLHRIKELKVKLVKKYSSKLPSIVADELLIGQVFMNLILNAIQAMPTGGILTITTKHKRARSRRKVDGTQKSHNFDINSPEYIEIMFSDTGDGIPEGIIRQIFEPFVSTKKKGVGLGLAIVSRIINDHKGTIEVDEKRKKGAKFTIRLPIRIDS